MLVLAILLYTLYYGILQGRAVCTVFMLFNLYIFMMFFIS